eukprot:14332292-Alexandrium_andersonii.AAC.1
MQRQRRRPGPQAQHAEPPGAATQRTPPACSKKHPLTALSRGGKPRPARPRRAASRIWNAAVLLTALQNAN